MKKIVFLIVTLIMVTSCYDMQDKIRLQTECDGLISRKSDLTESINSLRRDVASLSNEKNALKNGREPKYIVKFEIKQGTFTLDIGEHIKNQINAIEVEIPVSHDFYNQLSMGQDLTDGFKYGSLIFNGDFSKLHMRVIGKRIE